MPRVTLKTSLYVTYLAALSTQWSALARPSFMQSSGWELVDDEPTLRVETTRHSWGSDDVSMNAYEYYDSEGGQTTLQGTARGERGEADVVLEYELIEGTWTATVASQGDIATGQINHQQGISTNVLSGSAQGAGNTALVGLTSGIDDCTPGVGDCKSGIVMRIEGDDFWADFDMSQQYEAGDGSKATTTGSGSLSGAPPSPGVTQLGEAAAVSIISFIQGLSANINAQAEGSDGVVTTTETNAVVTPAAGR